MRALQRLKSIDFFKKLPADLTEATLTGGTISLLAALVMFFLLGMEFMQFMSVNTISELVVDRSPANELLKINFNISFPALSCEFATLDVSDALGTKKMNLTKTVRKAPITLDLERVGAATEEPVNHRPAPKYDDPGKIVKTNTTEKDEVADIDVSKSLTAENFQYTLNRYPIVVVNFYAPWCHWCQRLEPSWEAATTEIHKKYPESDGRIRFAKMDCTQAMGICRQNFIQGFPSLRVFRKGHDDIYLQGMHEHEAYTGDRTKEALVAFADSLVPSAGQPHRKVAGLDAAPKSSGCNMAGFVMVKKVPGTLHFTARSDGYSFDHSFMNMTHVIHSMYMGVRPTPRKYALLKFVVDADGMQKLHPAGLSPDWADKLHDQLFVSEHTQSTHEHFLQVVLTSIQPKDGHKASQYDAYEYTAHSHTYIADTIPSVKVTYDMSPIQIIVKETSKAWYQFLTTTCIILACVFTVANMLDSVAHTGLKMMKKNNMGKLG